MGIAQTTPLVTSVFFNHIGKPKALTGDAYGPTDGTWLVTPSGDGVPAGMKIKSIYMGCAGTALTTCTLHVTADPSGTAILGYAPGVVEALGTDFVVTWTLDLDVVNNLSEAVTALLSTAAGRFYLLLKPSVNVNVIYIGIVWERVTV